MNAKDVRKLEVREGGKFEEDEWQREVRYE
jgi:hypothetical protein